MYRRKWVDRLLSLRRIDLLRGCWIFVGAVDELGYGHHEGVATHILAVAEWGDFEGRDVDARRKEQVHHRCHARNCFNPKHLQVVTPAEHAAIHVTWRGFKERVPREPFQPKQFCPKGHDVTICGRTKVGSCKKCNSEYNTNRRKRIRSINAT